MNRTLIRVEGYLYSGFQSTVAIVRDKSPAQWALRQVVCGLWPTALLRQMEETPPHARQICDLTEQPVLSRLLPPPPANSCPSFHLISSFCSLANLVTLELRENLLKSLPT